MSRLKVYIVISQDIGAPEPDHRTHFEEHEASIMSIHRTLRAANRALLEHTFLDENYEEDELKDVNKLDEYDGGEEGYLRYSADGGSRPYAE